MAEWPSIDQSNVRRCSLHLYGSATCYHLNFIAIGTKMPSEMKGQARFRGYWSCAIRNPRHNARARINGPLNCVRLAMVDADDSKTCLSAFRSGP